MAQASSTQEITKRAKSNLAFALACLPKQRQQDMNAFYAFCRIVDDIADEHGRPNEEKRRDLAHWDQLVTGTTSPGNELEETIVNVFERYEIDRETVREIIRGMEMDLEIRRYESISDLEKYCFRVASAVGLVSVRIFGCENPESDVYAVELGHALQLTNILRDVGEDLREDNRIYLPMEDLARFGVTEDDLKQGSNRDGFLALMEFEAQRAEDRYQNARAARSDDDRPHLKASELMRSIYYALLQKMRRGGFRVLDQRYRLSSLQKMMLLTRTMVFGAS